MSRIFLSELYYIRENLRKPSPICQKRPIMSTFLSNPDDLVLLLDDWPDNKENEQPNTVTMATKVEEIASANYVDDLPEVDNEVKKRIELVEYTMLNLDLKH